MKFVYIKKRKCSGCGACSNICPRHAIKMYQDEEGFLFPQINQVLCVDCGICRERCDFKNKKLIEKNKKPQSYILQHKDRDGSQSGGAFIALSDFILENGGTVYGCVMDEAHRVKHIRACKKADRDLMRGSKYVQSDMTNVYRSISTDLQEGKLVLFTGTPCQSMAIANFFSENHYIDNLYIVDIICHGVPSPLILLAYIESLEQSRNGRITKFVFKDMSRVGWGGEHLESYILNGRLTEAKVWRDIFYDNIAMRECCGSCPYTTVSRKSDITICDAWQIEKRNPELLDRRGTSLVMLHSSKGKYIFNKSKQESVIKEVDIDDYMQVNMFMPSKINLQWRKRFFDIYKADGFDVAVTDFYQHRRFSKAGGLITRIWVRINKIHYRGIEREVAFLKRNRGK